MVLSIVVSDDQADIKKAGGEAPADRDVVLRVLYGMSSFLAAFQVIWGVSKLPLSARLAAGGIPSATLNVMEKEIAKGMAKGGFGATEGGGLFFARAFVTKYLGQTFVFVTHILPAPLWSAIIPFQLHPASRSPALKKVHRTLGGTFFALSTSLMVGFAAIMGRGLDIHPGAGWAKGAQGKALRDLPRLLRAVIPATHPFLFLSAAWFTYTMQRSLKAAWRKRFAEHEDWVMRHIASGQWISLMRIMLGPSMPVAVKRYGDTQDVVSSVFVGCGIGGWIACILAGELAVSRVRANRAASKAARSVKRDNGAEEALLVASQKELGA